MPAHHRFTGIGVCVFDAYGTLFDVTAAAHRLESRIGPRADRLAEIWRQKQLGYTWLRSLMGDYADFWTVTGDALDYALDMVGISDAALRADLMDLYRRLDAYPDVRATLGALKAAGLKTAILSNGEPVTLASACESAGITDLLDAVLSVDGLRVYKPHPTVYAMVGEHFGVERDAVAFMSSNGWDAHAASAFGFRVAWINRGNLPRERMPGAPDAVLGGLSELPGLLGV